MLRIGLTGGIGAGKSTVCELFRQFGIPIIDADQVSREVVAPGQPALTALIEQFGSSILTANGQLDRAALRSLVFADHAKRKQLEAILHPIIRQRMLAQAAALTSPYAILAIPLLIESRWQTLVDRILVIDCAPDTQLTRTMERDHLPLSQAKAIIASQAERSSRLREADDIIDNSLDLSHLQQQVTQLHQHYLELARKSGNRQ